METTMWSGVDQMQSITGKMDSSTINWPLLLLRSIAILIVYCAFRYKSTVYPIKYVYNLK